MKIPSVEYDNAVRACAYLGHKLAEAAANCGKRNTNAYLDSLDNLVDQFRAKFDTILEAERKYQNAVLRDANVARAAIEKAL